jgi:hypothetical protein
MPALILEHTTGGVTVTLAQRRVHLFDFHVVVARPRLPLAEQSDRIEHCAAGLTIPFVRLELGQISLRERSQPLRHLVGGLVVVVLRSSAAPGPLCSSENFRC